MLAGSRVAVRRAQLRRTKEARDIQRKRQVDAWFEEFDTNRSGLLERPQLSRLVQHLFGQSPERKALDLLMRKAVAIDTTGDGEADTVGISRKSVQSVLRLCGAQVANSNTHASFGLATTGYSEDLVDSTG